MTPQWSIESGQYRIWPVEHDSTADRYSGCISHLTSLKSNLCMQSGIWIHFLDVLDASQSASVSTLKIENMYS